MADALNEEKIPVYNFDTKREQPYSQTVESYDILHLGVNKKKNEQNGKTEGTIFCRVQEYSALLYLVY